MIQEQAQSEQPARRLYIVDDDPAVARTVERCGRSIGFVTRTFGSADSFLQQLDALDHGSIVLDIKMPGMNGLGLLKVLGEKRPDWPVIMLTGYAQVGSAVEAFRSGAVHFLRKPFKQKELREALEEAAELEERKLRQAIDPKQLESLQKLSKREREVLAAMAEGKQTKMIAWEIGISARTVDMHRSNILTKLSVRNAVQAVAIAKSSGFERES